MASFSAAILAASRLSLESGAKTFGSLRPCLDVACPGTQRRHLDTEDMQPVIEILAKTPFLDCAPEVNVRGRDHPDIDFKLARAPDPLNPPLLQKAQQVHLKIQRQIADFIEKNGTARSRFDLADLPLGRARERALFVAEQLRLDQRRRNRTAVDRNEGAVATVGSGMDGLGRQFLAASAFAPNQYRRRRTPDLDDGALERLNRFALADNPVIRSIANAGRRGFFLENCESIVCRKFVCRKSA